MADEQPLQAICGTSPQKSPPLLNKVSARGSVNSATGWII